MFSEQRQSARKVLRVKALIAREGEAPVMGRTADVSANGISVTTPDPLRIGQVGQLSFELFFDGKATTIHTRSRALYCIFSNGEFKVGFEFVNIDLSAMTVLARFLR